MSSSSTPGKPWQPPTAEELQKMLPQYEIAALLGRGGMGAVYQGQQLSLDRPVAIKILSNDLDEADASFAERFKNEARSMAKLSHPGIVAVFDFGETPDGLLYIVMEFVKGTDVAKMLVQQGRLHTDHAMAITAHVCDALKYAHERGIIHRDIKPANIMVSEEGVVKVADFGLAKMSGADGKTAGFTQSGLAMGTLHYMAPEALMLGHAVDHRADIYAVGVMLYQMLTGKLPQGMFELPSLQVPGLDPRFDGIIAKALRDDRTLRYQQVADMRLDLDSILTQPVVKMEAKATQVPAALPQHTRPQHSAGQPYRPPQREMVPPLPKKSSAGAFLWVAAAAVLAAGGLLWRKFTPTPAPQPIVNATTPEPVLSTLLPPTAGTKTVTLASPSTPMSTVTVPPAPIPAPLKATPSPAAPMPAELTTLDQQFLQLQATRVTAPFDADVAKLNTGYLGGLERDIAKEKAAGNLDGVYLLEAEKKRVVAKQAMPASDDASVTAALKNLRLIYRAAYAKIEAQREANLTLLTTPLTARLQALETELTKASRIADADAVREYRNKLTGVKDAANTLPAIAPTMMAARQKTSVPMKPISREDAVAGLLKLGARVNVRTKSYEAGSYITNVSQLPAKFIAYEIFAELRDTTRPLADEDLVLLTAFPDLSILVLSEQKNITPAGFAQLSALTSASNIQFDKTMLDDSSMKMIADMPALNVLNFGDTQITDKAVQVLGSRRNYVVLDFVNCDITDASAATLASFKSLKLLRFKGTKMTPDAIAILRRALPSCKFVTDDGG